MRVHSKRQVRINEMMMLVAIFVGCWKCLRNEVVIVVVIVVVVVVGEDGFGMR